MFNYIILKIKFFCVGYNYLSFYINFVATMILKNTFEYE